MNITKINNGKVELRKDNGTLLRTIETGDAIDADLNADASLVLVTTAKGKVDLYKDNGTLARTIVNTDATGAKFSGKDILIKTNKGKTELRKDNGTLIRVI